MRTTTTIGQKLMIGFGAMMALSVVLAVTCFFSIRTVVKCFDQAVDQTARKVLLANAVDMAQADMFIAQRGMLLDSFAKRSTSTESHRQLFLESTNKLKKAVEEIRPLLVLEESKRHLKQIEQCVNSWMEVFPEVHKLASQGGADAATQFANEKILPVREALSQHAEQLTQLELAALTQDKKELAATEQRSHWTMLVVISAMLALGAGVLGLVRRTSGLLRRLASELSQGAEQVASAAEQVSSSSQALAQGASEQAASLEETSASGEEINSMTRKNAENSRLAAQCMTETSQSVAAANRTLEDMVGSMNEINASSDKISRIIKAIDEIAFQTNILALNAAVEAARAGEAGMGFAVVADEVRNLAQRCAQAAKDTAALIEESIGRSNEGKNKLSQVVASIRTITESTNRVEVLVNEINLGSQEQARGIDQVAKAVAQMEQVTQKTAASAEENASAGEELSAQSATLKTFVERLFAMVDAGAQVGSERQAPVRHPRSSVVSRRSPRQREMAAEPFFAQESSLPFAPQARHRIDTSAFPLDDDFVPFPSNGVGKM
jgi:methyl-accepting chemotaxis protein/methyl-accepting chemotaxis protein-1 (serine sensor receptor)